LFPRLLAWQPRAIPAGSGSSQSALESFNKAIASGYVLSDSVDTTLVAGGVTSSLGSQVFQTILSDDISLPRPSRSMNCCTVLKFACFSEYLRQFFTFFDLLISDSHRTHVVFLLFSHRGSAEYNAQIYRNWNNTAVSYASVPSARVGAITWRISTGSRFYVFAGFNGSSTLGVFLCIFTGI
jgi:hypothetical protein